MSDSGREGNTNSLRYKQQSSYEAITKQPSANILFDFYNPKSIAIYMKTVFLDNVIIKHNYERGEIVWENNKLS